MRVSENGEWGKTAKNFVPETAKCWQIKYFPLFYSRDINNILAGVKPG